MAPPDNRPASALRRLGFSDLESAIYLELLKNPGSTGYRIGRSINKPHANVYKALIALEQKMVVIFEEGEPRTYRPVPPAELLELMRRRRDREVDEAEAALRELVTEPIDEDAFFRLTGRDQVYARARAMLKSATETVLIEALPLPAEELHGDLEEAVARNLSVVGIVCRQQDLIDGAKMHVTPLSDYVLTTWPGDQLILVTDAMEFLLALFDRETGEVRRAVWVSSPFIASILNNGLVANSIIHSMPEVSKVGGLNMHVFVRLPPGLRMILGMADAPGN